MAASKLIFIVWSILLLGLTGLLLEEYRFFKKQNVQLNHLKDDYANHLLALKKLMAEYDGPKEEKEQEKETNGMTGAKASKKKFLLVVNREPDYLKKSALAFARKENIDHALLVHYDPAMSTSRVQKAGVVRTNRRRSYTCKRSNSKKMATIDQLRKLQKEPIFGWPIDRADFWLSSMFGVRKKPDGTSEFHKGIDLAAVKGTPVKAAGPGVVIESCNARGYGNTIVIAHNRKFKTRYAHLLERNVKVGQEVKQYQKIGRVGATGTVRKSKRGGDGSHLHFEVYVFGKQANPFYFLA